MPSSVSPSDWAFYVLHLYWHDVTNIFDTDLHLAETIPTWIATLLAIAIALYTLTYPPRSLWHRFLLMTLLALPSLYAFQNHHSWLPSLALNDSFARGLYIWYAHMSHEMLVLNYTPVFEKDHPDTFAERFHQARKVLFAYRSSAHLRATKPAHAMTRPQFLLYHARKIILLYSAQATFNTVLPVLLPHNHCCHGAEYASLFRRLPASMQGAELVDRIDTAFRWCLVNMWMYESHFSLFAFLFVATGCDEPTEWGTALFNPLAEAWSVRRYWGVHWHGYISASFQAHVKVVTRRWCGMKRGLVTRVVENTAVFAVSGLGHGAVKVVQDWNRIGDWWVIVVWYTLQMLPIIVEGVVPAIPAVRRAMEAAEMRWPTVAPRLWRAMGYFWTAMWFIWCTSKYVHIREAWAERVYIERGRAHESAQSQSSMLPVVR